jgi:hypothetical protein
MAHTTHAPQHVFGDIMNRVSVDVRRQLNLMLEGFNAKAMKEGNSTAAVQKHGLQFVNKAGRYSARKVRFTRNTQYWCF